MIGMKSRFKLGDILLLLGTLFVFILSIILWIFIMTNDQYFSHINQTNNVTDQEHNRNRIASNLYIPTSSYGFKNGQLNRLYDSKKNLSLEFVNELKDVKYRNIEQASIGQENYEQFLNNPKYIQLTFPNEISADVLTKKKLTQINPKFRRIFISNNNHYFYLGNDRTFTIYRIDLYNANFSRLRSFARNAQGKLPVKFVHLKDNYEVFYTQQQHWRVYSYLTNSQNNSYFVSRLLGTAHVTARSNKNGWTTYSLNYYTKLRVPQNSTNRHNFLYTRYEKSQAKTVSDQLLDSVEYVHKIGLSEQDLRYFDFGDGSVDYINYIEGLPVFMDDHNVQVKTTFTQDAVELAFNNIDLQIPIPFDGQTRTLPPSAEVMQSLIAAGMKKSEIQRVIVAFRVEQDNSHDNLINLIPVYYVKAYDQWRSVSEWGKQNFSNLNKISSVKSEEGK